MTHLKEFDNLHSLMLAINEYLVKINPAQQNSFFILQRPVLIKQLLECLESSELRNVRSVVMRDCLRQCRDHVVGIYTNNGEVAEGQYTLAVRKYSAAMAVFREFYLGTTKKGKHYASISD